MKINYFKTTPFGGKSLHSAAIFAMPPGSSYNTILMNGGILKSQKLLAELTIKTYVKSATKSEINCPMNVVSYAQIV